MKFTVTKNQIIKAIKTEPLKSGNLYFIDYANCSDYINNNTHCAVCVVGSILSFRLGNTYTPLRLNNIASDLTKFAFINKLTAEDRTFDINNQPTLRKTIRVAAAHAKKRPLSTLSSIFEYIMRRPGMINDSGYANYKARRIMVNFVKKNFPAKLQLNTSKEY